MKNMKTKTLTLASLIILIIINSVLLFTYYDFYLSKKITSDIIESKEENHYVLVEITRNIYDKTLDDTISIIKDYVLKNGGFILIKSKDGKVLYSNKKDINKLFSSSTLVMIDHEEYELTYSKITITPGMKLIKDFILYEILLLIILFIVIFFISTRQFIDPMEQIIKDINDYKYGNIPRKKKMYKNMQKIQNSFVDMVDTLEIEKEYQNQIIASISHDIKTPLTSIIGYTDRLKNNNLDDERKKKYIEKIYIKSLTMKDILNEFDDYQSCNLKETIKKETINTKKIEELLLNEFKDDLKDKKIVLNVNNYCNCNIKVDIVKLKRVFSNIISNSVTHFNDKKGIINISIKKEKTKVRFEIADNGGGLDNEKNLIKIFEPLYTTDESRKIYGLGLSICKQIISAHNGLIYAENNDIGGLSIIFLLDRI